MGGEEEAGVDFCKDVALRVFGDGVTCLINDVFSSSDIKNTPDEGTVGELETSWP